MKIEVNTILLQRGEMVQKAICSWVYSEADEIDEEEVKSILHEEEYNYWQSAMSEKRKQEYLLGRLSAKIALEKIESTVLRYSEVNISSGVFRFPVIKTPKLNEKLSISHTDNHAVALIFPEEQPMGIDIERAKIRSSPFIDRHLTDKEIEIQSDLEVNSLMYWTAKESLSKVLKTGLMIDFNLLEVDNVKVNGSYTQFTYTFFKQYKSIVWEKNNCFIGLTLPKSTTPTFIKYDENEKLVSGNIRESGRKIW